MFIIYFNNTYVFIIICVFIYILEKNKSLESNELCTHLYQLGSQQKISVIFKLGYFKEGFLQRNKLQRCGWSERNSKRMC